MKRKNNALYIIEGNIEKYIENKKKILETKDNENVQNFLATYIDDR